MVLFAAVALVTPRSAASSTKTTPSSPAIASVAPVTPRSAELDQDHAELARDRVGRRW